VDNRLGFSLRNGNEQALLAAVNAWTNTHIRYAEDSALYGKTDYWADAPTTLHRGAGDCEDIAIVKMQLLAAAGVSRSDMYLTIARDLARHADHAMLVVRQGDKHWLLDNATSEVLDANSQADYRPIMSFSGSRKWLHGY
jgi:predicted transglutaminase-like cysteine proteinase